MREGIEVRLRAGDRERLEGVVSDRKSPQHHVWRARIVLMTACTTLIRPLIPRTSDRPFHDHPTTRSRRIRPE